MLQESHDHKNVFFFQAALGAFTQYLWYHCRQVVHSIIFPQAGCLQWQKIPKLVNAIEVFFCQFHRTSLSYRYMSSLQDRVSPLASYLQFHTCKFDTCKLHILRMRLGGTAYPKGGQVTLGPVVPPRISHPRVRCPGGQLTRGTAHPPTPGPRVPKSLAIWGRASDI